MARQKCPACPSEVSHPLLALESDVPKNRDSYTDALRHTTLSTFRLCLSSASCFLDLLLVVPILSRI
ncbi:unnamed protein product [Jaminaea pallidilutea]